MLLLGSIWFTILPLGNLYEIPSVFLSANGYGYGFACFVAIQNQSNEVDLPFPFSDFVFIFNYLDKYALIGILCIGALVYKQFHPSIFKHKDVYVGLHGFLGTHCNE